MRSSMAFLGAAREWIAALREVSSGFTFFRDAELAILPDKPNAVTVATSGHLLPDGVVLLGVDLSAPDSLMVGLNDFNSARFYMPPTNDSLVGLEKILISPALKMNEAAGKFDADEIQRNADVVTLKSRNKRETTIYLGLGDWAHMAQMETRMAANRYVSPIPLARATAPGRDGAASQYYSAFSASLCSLIRTRALDETLFYLHIEYIPAPADMMHSLQHGQPDNFFLKTLPNDLPVDVAVLLLENPGRQETMPQLIEDVYNENFESLQVLCVLSHLCGRFDDIFVLLASHPNQRFRDQIAQEAFFNRSQRVFEEVKKYGISPEILQSLEPASRPDR